MAVWLRYINELADSILPSITWHKYQQQKMVGPAGWVTYDLLRLSPTSITGRYAHLFTTFLISGIIHALTEIGQGDEFWRSRATQLFLTQAIGIVIEDLVQRIYRRQFVAKESSKRDVSVSARWIGYVWTMTFLVWSMPIVMYPLLAANNGEEKDKVVPFSVIERLLANFRRRY